MTVYVCPATVQTSLTMLSYSASSKQQNILTKERLLVVSKIVGWEGRVNRALDEPYKAHTFGQKSVYF